MNQAITKMAPIQRKRKKGRVFSLCVVFNCFHEGWQMGLGRSALKDEVRYMCFLHLELTGNVIVI